MTTNSYNDDIRLAVAKAITKQKLNIEKIKIMLKLCA